MVLGLGCSSSTLSPGPMVGNSAEKATSQLPGGTLEGPGRPPEVSV